MTIIKRYIAYSHRPGFRRFGHAWSKEPLTLGEVEDLPDDGSREHDQVDLLATSREVAKLIKLNREEAYPLRIAEGATDATARASKEARAELEQIRAAIAEARQEREAAEKAARDAREEAEGLQGELAQFQDAIEAAEQEAREKEAKASRLKGEPAQSQRGEKNARPAKKSDAKN